MSISEEVTHVLVCVSPHLTALQTHLSWIICWSASYMQKGCSIVVHSVINSIDPPVSADLSDPSLQTSLKCFCQDSLSVLDRVLPAAQASSVEKTLRHMVQRLAFLSEWNLYKKTSEYRKPISSYDVRVFTVSLCGHFLGILVWSSRCVSLF